MHPLENLLIPRILTLILGVRIPKFACPTPLDSNWTCHQICMKFLLADKATVLDWSNLKHMCTRAVPNYFPIFYALGHLTSDLTAANPITLSTSHKCTFPWHVNWGNSTNSLLNRHQYLIYFSVINPFYVPNEIYLIH